MDKLSPPGVLRLDGNVSENWRRWKSQFQFYISAIEADAKPEKVRCSIFLHCIGEYAQEVFHSFSLTEEEHSKLDVLFKKFEEYCNPKKNITYERYKFNRNSQKQNVSFNDYLTQLKVLAATCEFGELKDSLIRDRIVCGIYSEELRERLLRESELTLDRTIEICRANEITKSQIKSMHDNSEIIDTVKRNFKKGNTTNTKLKQKGNENIVFHDKKCKKCGKVHKFCECPAYGKKCHICGKMGHYAKMCNNKKLQEIESTVSTAVENEFILNSIKNAYNSTEWNIDLEINKKSVTCKIDTGAQVNVMPVKYVKQLKDKKNEIKPTHVKLTGYGGNNIEVLGKISFQTVYKGITKEIDFYVTKSYSDKPLIGLPTCEEFEIVKLTAEIKQRSEDNLRNIKEKYADVFEGLGCFSQTYEIKIDPNVSPKIFQARKIPIHLRNQLKEELDKMCKLNVIKQVKHPTEWVNPLILVEKPGKKLRICLDPQELNKAIKREHYQLPTIEEIASRLADAKIFSSLDANAGFWQIPLLEKSTDLTTFNTPYGRYKFLRMPFGICSAPEIFHRSCQEMLEGLEGVELFIDDILVWGKSQEEHDKRLEEVLQRVRENNLKLNKSKCSFGVTELKYLGHKLTSQGLKPDETKIKAIKQMPIPKNKKELERFLGIVTYLSKFIPNLSKETYELRMLIRKDAEWNWSDRLTKAFDNLKDILTNDPVLKYFDAKKPTTLQVDASLEGLGAVIMQEGHPIAYASKALTEAEKKYAQIEKELLAVVYGCERFHHFLYGKQFLVESDHKPLEIIKKKPLAQAPARLQRLLLRLQKYQFEIIYKPGKHMFISDTLSRAVIKQDIEGNKQLDDEEVRVHNVMKVLETEVESHINLFQNNLPVTDERLHELKVETEKDEELQALKSFNSSEWPKSKSNVPPNLKTYWPYRWEINEINGIMFKGTKILIPFSMRKNTIKTLHQGHLGIEKTKRLARDILFWPGINQQIEDYVTKCAICQQKRRNNPKQPMISHEIPTLPWEMVGSDLFFLEGKSYLIIADYFSRYFEIVQVKNQTSEEIIHHMKSIFARQGIPSILKTDNGPQYASQEFKNFSTQWKFKHITCSPNYPQSNGFIEKMVGIAKQMLIKTKMEGSDIYLSLLNYRNAPLKNSPSPSQLLNSRRLRSLLPMTTSQMIPQDQNIKKFWETRKEQQRRQKQYYDRGTKALPELQKDEPIRMQDGKDWKKAVVKGKAQTPRSYIVQTEEGNTYRRNRRQLRKDYTQNSEKDKETGENNLKKNSAEEGKSALPDRVSEEDTQEVQHERGTPKKQETTREEMRDKSSDKIVITRSGRVVKPPIRYPY